MTEAGSEQGPQPDPGSGSQNSYILGLLEAFNEVYDPDSIPECQITFKSDGVEGVVWIDPNRAPKDIDQALLSISAGVGGLTIHVAGGSIEESPGEEKGPGEQLSQPVSAEPHPDAHPDEM